MDILIADKYERNLGDIWNRCVCKRETYYSIKKQHAAKQTWFHGLQNRHILM